MSGRQSGDPLDHRSLSPNTATGNHPPSSQDGGPTAECTNTSFITKLSTSQVQKMLNMEVEKLILSDDENCKHSNFPATTNGHDVLSSSGNFLLTCNEGVCFGASPAESLEAKQESGEISLQQTSYASPEPSSRFELSSYDLIYKNLQLLYQQQQQLQREQQQPIYPLPHQLAYPERLQQPLFPAQSQRQNHGTELRQATYTSAYTRPMLSLGRPTSLPWSSVETLSYAEQQLQSQNAYTSKSEQVPRTGAFLDLGKLSRVPWAGTISSTVSGDCVSALCTPFGSPVQGSKQNTTSAANRLSDLSPPPLKKIRLAPNVHTDTQTQTTTVTKLSPSLSLPNTSMGYDFYGPPATVTTQNTLVSPYRGEEIQYGHLPGALSMCALNNQSLDVKQEMITGSHLQTDGARKPSSSKQKLTQTEAYTRTKLDGSPTHLGKKHTEARGSKPHRSLSKRLHETAPVKKEPQPHPKRHCGVEDASATLQNLRMRAPPQQLIKPSCHLHPPESSSTYQSLAPLPDIQTFLSSKTGGELLGLSTTGAHDVTEGSKALQQDMQVVGTYSKVSVRPPSSCAMQECRKGTQQAHSGQQTQHAISGQYRFYHSHQKILQATQQTTPSTSSCQGIDLPTSANSQQPTVQLPCITRSSESKSIQLSGNQIPHAIVTKPDSYRLNTINKILQDCQPCPMTVSSPSGSQFINTAVRTTSPKSLLSGQVLPADFKVTCPEVQKTKQSTPRAIASTARFATCPRQRLQMPTPITGSGLGTCPPNFCLPFSANILPTVLAVNTPAVRPSGVPPAGNTFHPEYPLLSSSNYSQSSLAACSHSIGALTSGLSFPYAGQIVSGSQPSFSTPLGTVGGILEAQSSTQKFVILPTGTVPVQLPQTVQQQVTANHVRQPETSTSATAVTADPVSQHGALKKRHIFGKRQYSQSTDVNPEKMRAADQNQSQTLHQKDVDRANLKSQGQTKEGVEIPETQAVHTNPSLQKKRRLNQPQKARVAASTCQENQNCMPLPLGQNQVAGLMSQPVVTYNLIVVVSQVPPSTENTHPHQTLDVKTLTPASTAHDEQDNRQQGRQMLASRDQQSSKSQTETNASFQEVTALSSGMLQHGQKEQQDNGKNGKGCEPESNPEQMMAHSTRNKNPGSKNVDSCGSNGTCMITLDGRTKGIRTGSCLRTFSELMDSSESDTDSSSDPIEVVYCGLEGEKMDEETSEKKRLYAKRREALRVQHSEEVKDEEQLKKMMPEASEGVQTHCFGKGRDGTRFLVPLRGMDAMRLVLPGEEMEVFGRQYRGNLQKDEAVYVRPI